LGEYFRAHEIWEEVWLIAAENDKVFLQGMIQLAAAFHHHTRGNVNGTRSLLEAGLKKLRKFPAEYRGMKLNAVRDTAGGVLETLAKGDHIAPDDLPRIELADQNR